MIMIRCINRHILSVLLFTFAVVPLRLCCQDLILSSSNLLTLTQKEGIKASGVIELHVDKYGMIWTQYGGGIIELWNGRSFQLIRTPEKVGRIVQLLEEANKLLIIYEHHVAFYDEELNQFILSDIVLKSRALRKSSFIINNDLFVASEDGLIYVIDLKTMSAKDVILLDIKFEDMKLSNTEGSPYLYFTETKLHNKMYKYNYEKKIMVDTFSFPSTFRIKAIQSTPLLFDDKFYMVYKSSLLEMSWKNKTITDLISFRNSNVNDFASGILILNDSNRIIFTGNKVYLTNSNWEQTRVLSVNPNDYTIRGVSTGPSDAIYIHYLRSGIEVYKNPIDPLIVNYDADFNEFIVSCIYLENIEQIVATSKKQSVVVSARREISKGFN